MHSYAQEEPVLVSPYTPGATPHHLAGRTMELRAIEDHLAPVIAYGRAASGLLVLHGPRGVGKTSLLDSAVNAAREEHGFVTAWTACQRGEPFLADVASRVGRALERADLMGKKARLTVEKVAAEVSVPTFVKFSAQLSRAGAATDRPAPPSGAVSAVEDLLHESAVLARGDGSRRGSGLIVAIDELHAGQVGELAVLLNAIQNLHHDSGNNPLAVLGAGIPAVRGLLPSAATFGERSRWREVAPLDEPALRELLTVPAAELKVSWHPDAVRAGLVRHADSTGDRDSRERSPCSRPSDSTTAASPQRLASTA